jgi:hypothetical protein
MISLIENSPPRGEDKPDISGYVHYLRLCPNPGLLVDIITPPFGAGINFGSSI